MRLDLCLIGDAVTWGSRFRSRLRCAASAWPFSISTATLRIWSARGDAVYRAGRRRDLRATLGSGRLVVESTPEVIAEDDAIGGRNTDRRPHVAIVQSYR